MTGTARRLGGIDALWDDLWLALMRTSPEHDCARCFHLEMETALRKLGFNVRREVPAFTPCDGRRGRIDLLAQRDGHWFWLELDNRTPRTRSVEKIKAIGRHGAVMMRRPKRMLMLLPGGVERWYQPLF